MPFSTASLDDSSFFRNACIEESTKSHTVGGEA